MPAWLARRMAALGRIVVEALILEYGRDEVLRRLSHPFWFQSFGAVMGMDWHSSGITTSVIGALRRGLAPVADELGLYVCGGRGARSRETPQQLSRLADRLGLDGAQLVRASRLVAKVDGAALQDGFSIYLHGFVLAADGRWVVVQQGMNPERRQARRYHWLSEGLQSFVDTPHAAVDGETQPRSVVNLADARARRARDEVLRLAARGPEAALLAAREARAAAAGRGGRLPHLQLPLRHAVHPEDVVERRLHGALAAVERAAPSTFEDLLLTRGLGERTLTALAFVADVVHGAPSRFSDPARHSLALGGKDGHPFPVPLRVYDDALRVLRRAIQQARLGRSDAMDALSRLDAQARALEATHDPRRALTAAFIERERRASFGYGGMTAHGPARPPAAPPQRRPARQLGLFAPPVGGGRGPFV